MKINNYNYNYTSTNIKTRLVTEAACELEVSYTLSGFGN